MAPSHSSAIISSFPLLRFLRLFVQLYISAYFSTPAFLYHVFLDFEFLVLVLDFLELVPTIIYI